MVRRAILLFVALFALFANIEAQVFPTGADISFRQDSIMPSKVYVIVKVLAPYYASSFQYDMIWVSWADTGYGISLTDTFQTSVPGLYVKTYIASHTYSISYMDSSVIISTTLGNRQNFITNINYGYSDQFPFSIQTTANLKVLKNSTGYTSPIFDTTLYIATDTIDQEIIYDPHVQTYNSDSTFAQLINPIQIGNEYFMPNLVYSCPDSSLVCNAINGVLDWSQPCHAGFYVTVFQVSQYINDTLVSTAMRDVMFTIADTISTNTAINNVQADKENGIQVYPVPNNGSFEVTFQNDLQQNAVITITDYLGQRIYGNSTFANSLNVSTHLDDGIYIVNVQVGSENHSSKFIIIN